ncbi:6018_t:CDS:1, partial [Acaulospora morrowiae]
LSINNIDELKHNTPQRKWVDWIKKYTVPNAKTTEGLPWNDNKIWLEMVGDSKIKPSIYAVAVATWWSLKEGIFEEPYSKFIKLDVPETEGYLFNYNLCTEMENGKVKENSMIGPNKVCLENAPQCGSCWQNGIFGMEMGGDLTAVKVAIAAENIYKGKTYWTVIKDTMSLAGFGPGSSVYQRLLECFPNNKSVPARDLNMECANLVKIWLVRNHLVGLSVVVNNNPSCLRKSTFDDPRAECKDPWHEYPNPIFAHSFLDAKNTINILAKYFANQ